jgi:hypothetical protein
MPQATKSEIKHYTCNTVSVAVEIAEAVRVNPNGETSCSVCGQVDANLRFSSLIELDNGYVLERPL